MRSLQCHGALVLTLGEICLHTMRNYYFILRIITMTVIPSLLHLSALERCVGPSAARRHASHASASKHVSRVQMVNDFSWSILSLQSITRKPPLPLLSWTPQ